MLKNSITCWPLEDFSYISPTRARKLKNINANDMSNRYLFALEYDWLFCLWTASSIITLFFSHVSVLSTLSKNDSACVCISVLTSHLLPSVLYNGVFISNSWLPHWPLCILWLSLWQSVSLSAILFSVWLFRSPTPCVISKISQT